MRFAVIVATAAIVVPSLIILFAYIGERWQAWRGTPSARPDRDPSFGLPHRGARR